MFSKRNVWAAAILVVSMAFLSSATVTRIFAAQGNIYVSPASKSVTKGDNVTIGARINSGGASVDGVEIYINYDASKLKYLSMSPNTSAFPVELSASGGSGSISIVRGNLSGGVSGDQLVANLTFKAQEAGNASISIASSSNATASGEYIDPARTGGSVTVNNPASDSGSDSDSDTDDSDGSSSGGDTGSGGDSGSGDSSSDDDSDSSDGGSGDDQSGDDDDDAEPTPEPQYTQALIKVKTRRRIKAYIEYGTTKEFGLSTKPKTFRRTGRFALADLNPGTVHYYRIVRVRGSQEKPGPTKTFKTKGLTVVVKVVDRFNKPVRRRKCTLFSDPIAATTDENGVATFQGVAPGEHKLVFEDNGEEVSQAIVVANNVESEIAQVDGVSQVAENAQPQQFSVTYTPPEDNNLVWYSAIAAALLAGVGIVLAIIMVKRRRHAKAGAGPGPQNGPPNNQSGPGSIIGPGGNNGVGQQ